MNSNQSIIEKLNKFQKEIKRIVSQYEGKDLSSSERYDAIKEVRIFNEKVEVFSHQLGNLQGKAKSLALAAINSLNKIGAGFEKNIHANTPASEYM